MAGRSWIEVKNQVYSFVIGEKIGLNTELVYVELQKLLLNMKEAGYVPDSECLRYDLEALD